MLFPMTEQARAWKTPAEACYPDCLHSSATHGGRLFSLGIYNQPEKIIDCCNVTSLCGHYLSAVQALVTAGVAHS